MIPLRQGYGGRVRIERDPAFWTAVAAHPALRVMMGDADPALIGALAGRENVLPLASDHGGYLFIRQDALGFVAELHSLFTPEGWGREALIAGIEALGAVWLLGFQTVVTLEMRDNPRSRPPKSFGFVQAGDWREGPFGAARQWILTRAAWEASPTAKRRAKCLH
jgi:hypothetical protein